jgi:hypothetical protein
MPCGRVAGALALEDGAGDLDEAPEAETGMAATVLEWARLDSNQGPTDYENAP